MPIHRLNMRPSVPDLRDHVWHAARGYTLGASEDLGVAVPFRDQGDEGSCGGFADTSAFAALWMLAGNAYREFSPAFAYYEARRLEGTTGADSGTTIRDEMRVLLDEGACPADVMPYVPGAYTAPPPPNARDAAAGYRIGEYWRINHTLDAIAYALHVRQPVVIGIAVYDSFEAVGGQGLIPMPRKGEPMRGGHALYCHRIERDRSTEGGGAITGDNSWGNDAPFHLPLAYLLNRHLTFEIRTMRLPVAA